MLLLLHRVKGDEKQRRSVCQRNHIASHNGRVNRKLLKTEQGGQLRPGLEASRRRARGHRAGGAWVADGRGRGNRRVHAIRGAFVPTTLRGKLAFLSGAVP